MEREICKFVGPAMGAEKAIATSCTSRLLQKVSLLITSLIISYNRPRWLPIRSRGLLETQGRRVATPSSPSMIPRQRKGCFHRALPLPETHLIISVSRKIDTVYVARKNKPEFTLDRTTYCCHCIIYLLGLETAGSQKNMWLHRYK